MVALKIVLFSQMDHPLVVVVFGFHLEPQDPRDVVPNEKTTQRLLLKETISIVFSPWINRDHSHSPGHIKLCLSHLDYILLSPWTPHISTHFIYHQPPQSVFLSAPLPPPTHHSFSLSVFFVSLADWIPAPISLSPSPPLLAASPQPSCLWSWMRSRNRQMAL